MIFGNNGQLGRDLTVVFKNDGLVAGADLPEIDITDGKAVSDFVSAFQPSVVINAAAYTDVEGAEDDPKAAFLANQSGARTVARAAKAVGAAVVYYSTDYVFGGMKSSPYDPDDPTEPIGVYAHSKLAGEFATIVENPEHFIVRTAWLYGIDGNNFPEKIIAAAQRNSSLKVVDDEVGAPTYTWDLADATLALARTRAYGIYHVVNRGQCSRFEFAKVILELANIDTPVHPCSSSEFPTKAARPLYSVLSVEKLEKVTNYTMRGWREALADFMARRDETR